MIHGVKRITRLVLTGQQLVSRGERGSFMVPTYT
jgi:hypothetical protein